MLCTNKVSGFIDLRVELRYDERDKESGALRIMLDDGDGVEYLGALAQRMIDAGCKSGSAVARGNDEKH